jgi:hypothetical protein
VEVREWISKREGAGACNVDKPECARDANEVTRRECQAVDKMKT